MLLIATVVAAISTLNSQTRKAARTIEEEENWLKPGAIVGWHVIEAKPDIAAAKFEEFIREKYIPGWSHAFPGSRVFLLEGRRGENLDQFVFLWVFENEETRDSYWPEPDVSTDLYKEHRAKLDYLYGEKGFNSLGSFKASTDYLVML